jgi:hypothetical protein
MTDLGTPLPEGDFSLALDINNRGLVVGESRWLDGEHATLWTVK